MRLGGTNEKAASANAASASEFSRMSTRLSARDRTFSGIFCGRWVEVSRYRPNLRPSAAIRIAYPAATATTGSGGSAGQTLCASSITIRTGLRSWRRRHRSPSTAAAIRDCSSRVGGEPRSMTTQRMSWSCTASRTEPVSPGAQLPVEFDRENLAETGRAATLQHDVAAGLELKAVQRGLEREPAPVHRGGERKHGRFHFPARLAEAIQLAAEP
jgi:hypothetical protein